MGSSTVCDDEDAVLFDERKFYKDGFGLQLENLRKSDELCDITLRSNTGQQIRAHKVVLAARIPYFKATFSSGLFQSDEVVLDSALFKFNESGIENVIQYAYFGQIVCSKELTDIFNTIVFADYLQIQSLKDECESHLCLHVCMEKCVDIANIAKTYNCSTLMGYCLRCITKNWEDLLKHPTWVNLNFDVLSVLLSADDINAYDEDSILNAVMSWVEHETSRKSFLPSLLSDVHLSKLCDFSSLTKLQNHPLVQENPDCLRMVLGYVPTMIDSLKDTGKNELFDGSRKSKKAKTAAQRTYFGHCMYMFGGKTTAKPTVELERNRDSDIEYNYNDAHREFKIFKLNVLNEPQVSVSSRNEKNYAKPIAGAGVSVYNNTIFIVGGRTTILREFSRSYSSYKSHFHAFTYYDVSKRKMVRTYITDSRRVLPELLFGTAASCVKDTLVVAGGQSSTLNSLPDNDDDSYDSDDSLESHYSWQEEIIASVYLYNIPTKKWSVGCSLEYGRMHHKMATLNNKVYCVGGTLVATNEVYDICLDKWSTTCNLLEQRSEHALVATDSRLVAIGGRSEKDNIFTTEYYDPRIKGWMKYVDMPIRSRGFTASELQGEIYLVGGCLGNSKHKQDLVYEVYILDQRSNKWRLGPEAPVSRMHGYSIVIP